MVFFLDNDHILKITAGFVFFIIENIAICDNYKSQSKIGSHLPCLSELSVLSFLGQVQEGEDIDTSDPTLGWEQSRLSAVADRQVHTVRVQAP